MLEKGRKGEGEKGGRGDEERSHIVRASLFLFYIFASFACFAGNSSAQDLESIRSGIASGNAELIRNALFQIKNLHSEAASRLALPALSDRDEIVRATAANAVIFLPKTDATQALLPLLNDKDEFVRGETAFALGEVRDASAETPLIRTLQNDKSRIVKAAAATALGKIGDVSGVEPLSSILRAKPNEDSEFLRRSASHAIGLIAESIQKQERTTSTPENFLPDKYKSGNSKKPGTNQVLVSQKPEFRSATAILSKVLQNRSEADDTRREAAFALGAIGDPSSASLLRSNLNSPDNYLAEICMEALLKIEHTQ